MDRAEETAPLQLRLLVIGQICQDIDVVVMEAVSVLMGGQTLPAEVTHAVGTTDERSFVLVAAFTDKGAAKLAVGDLIHRQVFPELLDVEVGGESRHAAGRDSSGHLAEWTGKLCLAIDEGRQAVDAESVETW